MASLQGALWWQVGVGACIFCLGMSPSAPPVVADNQIWQESITPLLYAPPLTGADLSEGRVGRLPVGRMLVVAKPPQGKKGRLQYHLSYATNGGSRVVARADYFVIEACPDLGGNGTPDCVVRYADETMEEGAEALAILHLELGAVTWIPVEFIAWDRREAPNTVVEREKSGYRIVSAELEPEGLITTVITEEGGSLQAFAQKEGGLPKPLAEDLRAAVEPFDKRAAVSRDGLGRGCIIERRLLVELGAQPGEIAVEVHCQENEVVELDGEAAAECRRTALGTAVAACTLKRVHGGGRDPYLRFVGQQGRPGESAEQPKKWAYCRTLWILKRSSDAMADIICDEEYFRWNGSQYVLQEPGEEALR